MFRESRSEPRRLGQGQARDTARTRRAYESRPLGPHRWRAPSGTADRPAARPPVGITVVDAALALGPHDTWWADGRPAARARGSPARPRPR
ncbi:DUF6185 family protein [Streptomyces sp. NRRL S-31]|uniref:DUF6185 family protein n=1 Tax=Streptomyces sp. NRRL S-31 TaxID=1463898 RepID=UPI0004C88550|nr:DUF6185 family protein [Streptomyces sp. NRRL S-31]